MREQTSKTLFGTTSKTGSVPSVFDTACARQDLVSQLKSLEGDWYVTSFKLWDCYAQNWASPYPVVLRFENTDVLVDCDEEGFSALLMPVDVNVRIACEECLQWREDPEDGDLWGTQVVGVDISEDAIRFNF